MNCVFIKLSHLRGSRTHRVTAGITQCADGVPAVPACRRHPRFPDTSGPWGSRAGQATLPQAHTLPRTCGRTAPRPDAAPLPGGGGRWPRRDSAGSLSPGPAPHRCPAASPGAPGGGGRAVPLRGIVGRLGAARPHLRGAGRGAGREGGGRQPAGLGRAGPASSLPPPSHHGKWAGAAGLGPSREGAAALAPPQPPSATLGPRSPLDGRFLWASYRGWLGQGGAELTPVPKDP